MNVDIKRNDTYPTLEVTVYKDGTPLDLTGATVTFHMVNSAGVAKITNAAATVEAPATDGKISYTWTASDTDTVGAFRAEFELTLAGSEKLSVPQNEAFITVNILPDLNAA